MCRLSILSLQQNHSNPILFQIPIMINEFQESILETPDIINRSLIQPPPLS